MYVCMYVTLPFSLSIFMTLPLYGLKKLRPSPFTLTAHKGHVLLHDA